MSTVCDPRDSRNVGAREDHLASVLDAARRGGVRRYRVLRSSSDPNLVAVDLEFESRAAAEAFAAALTELWKTVGDRFGWRQVPDARVFECAAVGEH